MTKFCLGNKYSKYISLILFLIFSFFISILPFINLNNNIAADQNNDLNIENREREREGFPKNNILNFKTSDKNESLHFDYIKIINHMSEDEWASNNEDHFSFQIAYKISGAVLTHQTIGGLEYYEDIKKHKINLYYRDKNDSSSSNQWIETIEFDYKNNYINFSYNMNKNSYYISESNGVPFILEPCSEYIFSFRVDHELPQNNENNNHITGPIFDFYEWGNEVETIPIRMPKRPTLIKSLTATTISSREAEVYYRIIYLAGFIPVNELAKINSIKLFNDGKEIAQASIPEPSNDISGIIKVDGLTPGKDYIFELKIETEFGWSSGKTNKITTPLDLEDAEKPIIDSVNAKSTGTTTAEVDYKIIIPSSEINKPTIINSIRLFNNRQEIAQASNTNPSGTIKVDGLTPGKDYTFELRVYSNVGVVKKNLNTITASFNPAEKPTIDSVVAKSTGATTAKVDYKITIPSLENTEPTTINSIKVFNDGKEIAEAPNTNPSGTIKVDGLTPEKDYTFELRVDSNVGEVKKISNTIAISFYPAEKPIIDSVNAKSTGTTTAEIDYKITIPSSENTEPTTINSIKVFNDGKEIAEAPNTNPSGTIKVDGLTPEKDYTFELRVDSNAGVVTEKTNIITMSVDKIQVLDKSISPGNLGIGGKYRVFVDLKLNRNLINETENIQFSATNSRGEELINYHPELILDSRVKSNHSCEYRYVFYLDEEETYKNISLEITLINTEGQNITELSDKFSNVDSITNGKIEYSKNSFFSFSNSTFVYIIAIITASLILITIISLVIFNLTRFLA